MSDEKPDEPEEGVPAASPHGILHLLPTAPQELVVEVYWHLVGQLQTAGKGTPEVRRALDNLNEAYRALMTRPDQNESESPSEETQPDHGTTSGPRGAWPIRHFRRPQPESVRPQGSPWELLHLDPRAPPGVVELAFDFWQQRLRTSSGDSAAPELEELERAYCWLQGTRSDAPPDPEGGDADEETCPLEPDEGNQDEASVSALRRVRQAVAGMLAYLGPRTEAVRTVNAQEGPVAAHSDSIEEPAAVDTTRPAAREANESSDKTGDDVGDSAVAETAEAGGVPEFLSRETSSQEPESAPHAEAPFVASGSGEQEGAHGGPEQAKPEAIAEELPAPPSAEPLRVGPSPSTETGEVESPMQGGTWLHVQARLVPESGSAPRREIIIRQEPISLGTAPTCDVVFSASGLRERQVEARIWRQHGRFMFHSIRSTPSVLVNGQAIIWVVLEDGDRLQVGDDVFRFQLGQDGVTC